MHTRHIIEFYQCLIEQASEGQINYDSRKRDVRIESDPAFAKSFHQLYSFGSAESFVEDGCDGVLVGDGFVLNVHHPHFKA